MTLLSLFAIILFLVGLYFYLKTTDDNYVEALTNSTESTQQRCPNLLIKKGPKFYLYNSKLAKVPGVNPIEFNNLEEYVDFLSWQKSQNIKCPVLYLQETFNAQGNPCYTVRPGVTDLMGGLPPCASKGPNSTLLVDAGRNDPPYNKNSYPAYDQNNQYIGSTTPLDTMNHDKQFINSNAMSSSWKGVKYTKDLVKSGYYKENEVNIQTA